jgi:hypothetical protein
MNHEDIICLVADDDGDIETFIWQRTAMEDQALLLELLPPELQAVYSLYDTDMPPALAVHYVENILWSLTEAD